MSLTTTSNRPQRPRVRKLLGQLWFQVVVAAVLGVAVGLLFWFWNGVGYGWFEVMDAATPGLGGFAVGIWLIGGVIGGLVIRKPGAALFCELLAAVLEGFLGTHFGWTVVISGLVQGLGAELVFLLTGYRRFGLAVATAAGALSGLFLGVSEDIMYNYEWALDQKVVYAALTTLSGAVIAGALMWLVVRALQATGVLGALASGATRRR